MRYLRRGTAIHNQASSELMLLSDEGGLMRYKLATGQNSPEGAMTRLQDLGYIAQDDWKRRDHKTVAVEYGIVTQ